MSKTFLTDNSLYHDKCAITTRNLQNQSIDEYNLQGFFPTADCRCPLDKNQLMLDNPNLHVKDGYGNVNRCTVDIDSSFRLGELGHPKGREQLCPRWFDGVPNLDRGGLIPNIESRLLSGEDTQTFRDCCPLAEKDYDRWTPLPSCMAAEIQNPIHLIPELADKNWVNGGASTRTYCRDNEYLRHCGFIQTGHAWVRPDKIGPEMLPKNEVVGLIK